MVRKHVETGEMSGSCVNVGPTTMAQSQLKHLATGVLKGVALGEPLVLCSSTTMYALAL